MLNISLTPYITFFPTSLNIDHQTYVQIKLEERRADSMNPAGIPHTPEAHNLRLYKLTLFLDWPEIVLYFGLHTFTTSCSLNSLFL